ncbi:UNVERIFIED_CONTAM: hypothetical protein Scaly_1941900 [Sesamum calycinum]|uniref:Uncharacterized protein n=1 Tax=Sesamum calycinum TaxID=2727403 RepID=A0AAW2NHM5_9LAMI
MVHDSLPTLGDFTGKSGSTRGISRKHVDKIIIIDFARSEHDLLLVMKKSFDLGDGRMSSKSDDQYNKFEEELESTKRRILTRIKRIVKDGSQTSERNMKLEFRNRISEVILTGEEIKGEGDTSIEVVIVDESTGNVVDVGPEASANVGIVLLKGEPDALAGDDWTVQEYNQNIVQEIEGKQPLLAGNVLLKLQRGVGFLENIKLRHHASKIRPPVFRLCARVVDTFNGDHIKEAKTESFTVKDFRNKYYKKHETPSLSDEVSRLVNIRKGGKINKRLQDNKIYTVEDFLIRLLIDPEGLRSIVNLGPTKWELTINNARASLSDKRTYCYVNSEQKMGIVFNVLGQVLGLYLKNQYVPTNMLSENNKIVNVRGKKWDATVKNARECQNSKRMYCYINHWQNIGVAFTVLGDLSGLYLKSQYVPTTMLSENHKACFSYTSSLLFFQLISPTYEIVQNKPKLNLYYDSLRLKSTFMDPLNSLKPHYDHGGCEIIGGSSSRSNFLFQGIASATNSTRKAGTEDFCSFGTDDVENIFDAPMQLSPQFPFYPETMLDLEEFFHQNNDSNWQVKGPVNEPNCDEQVAETAVAFADTHISNPPNRWRKLFCVSTWFSIRKRVSMAGIHNRKKQKLH